MKHSRATIILIILFSITLFVLGLLTFGTLNFEGLNKYLSVSEHLQEIISPNDNKLSSDLKPEHKKPWWKIW